MNYKPTYLIFVSSDNHNKYYNMYPENNSFTVEYGRVDVTKAVTHYPIDKWDKKYNEKIKKGYKDITDLKQSLIEELSTTSPKSTLKEIENESVRAIIKKLQSLAHEIIIKNYSVKSSAVTQEMVDAAQEVIDELSSMTTDVNLFNSKLIRLFEIIPRKMAHVRDYLADTDNDFAKIITNEQDLLDVMRGQIFNAADMIDEVSEEQKDYTILDEMGITMEEATPEDIKLIKNSMDAHGSNSSHKFRRAWKVTNLNTQKKFDDFIKSNNIKDTKLLFHGSRSENWFSIMKQGMRLHPNAKLCGKMFGMGLYFAPKCQKSIGYTSLGGSYWANGNDKIAYMSLFETAYGKPYHTDNNREFFYNYGYHDLINKHPDCNCVHAHAGHSLRNDEIIYYNENQVTIKYLIEIGN